MARKPPPKRNPTVLVATILGSVVLLGLVALWLLRRPASAPPRRPAPSLVPIPPPSTPSPTPVYGGARPRGRGGGF